MILQEEKTSLADPDSARRRSAGAGLPAAQRPLRVVVLSQERLFGEVVAAALAAREGLQVAPIADERRVPVQGVATDDTDIVLIDASRDLQWALSRTREAPESWPRAEVIAVGLEREDAGVVELAEAGARGYALAGAGPDQLVEVIRSVHAGRTPCSPPVLAAVVARIAVLSRLPPGPAPREIEPLTAREGEILGLLAEGLGNKEIGRRLGITVQTVKNHVHKVLEKLKVHRRRKAVRLAYDLGLLAGPVEVPVRRAADETDRS